jgi:hypothetical protein
VAASPACGRLHPPTADTSQVGARPRRDLQAGLDLDHQQGPCLRVVGKKIDPAVRAAVDDLDFSGREPSRGPQATIDMARTSGMNEVALTSLADDDRRASHELDLEIERVGDPLDEVERRIGPP